MAFAATGSQRLWGTILPGNGMHWLAEHARKSRILELELEKSYTLALCLGTTADPVYVPATGSKFIVVPPPGPLATS